MLQQAIAQFKHASQMSYSAPAPTLNMFSYEGQECKSPHRIPCVHITAHVHIIYVFSGGSYCGVTWQREWEETFNKGDSGKSEQ